MNQKKGPSEDEPILPTLEPRFSEDHGRGGLPTGNFRQTSADIGEAAYRFYTGIFQRREFLIRRALAARDNRTGMAHTLAFRGSNPGNVGYNRLGDIRLDEGCRFLFRRAADLTDHHDSFSGGILLEH